VAIAGEGRDKVNVPPESLFDTSKMIPEVSIEEMEKLVSGVSLRDVLAARRATTELPNELGDPDISEVAEDSVDELFSN
jgi:hypothetical protein